MIQPAAIAIHLAHCDPVVNAGLHALLREHGLDPAVAAGPSVAGGIVITDYDDALVRLGASQPGHGPAILVLTQRCREFDLRTALSAGVHGYLLQHAPGEQLALAVHMLACGQRYVSTELARYIADSFSRDRLTGRETDVLQLLAQGCCNKTIARELGIGVGTVKSHVKGVFDKLGAKARTQAVVLAARRGMLPHMEGVAG